MNHGAWTGLDGSNRKESKEKGLDSNKLISIISKGPASFMPPSQVKSSQVSTGSQYLGSVIYKTELTTRQRWRWRWRRPDLMSGADEMDGGVESFAYLRPRLIDRSISIPQKGPKSPLPSVQCHGNRTRASLCQISADVYRQAGADRLIALILIKFHWSSTWA